VPDVVARLAMPRSFPDSANSFALLPNPSGHFGGNASEKAGNSIKFAALGRLAYGQRFAFS